MIEEMFSRNHLIAASDFTWVMFALLVLVTIVHRALYVAGRREYPGRRAALVFLVGIAMSEFGLGVLNRGYWFLVNKAWADGWIETPFGGWLLEHAPIWSAAGLLLHVAGVVIALSPLFAPMFGRWYWPGATCVAAATWFAGLLI